MKHQLRNRGGFWRDCWGLGASLIRGLARLLVLPICVVIGLPSLAFGSTLVKESLPSVSLRLGHSNVITDLAISPNGRFLATSSFDNTALIWDIPSARETRRLVHTTYVTSAAFVSDGMVATGDGKGAIVLWDVASGKALKMTKVGGAVDSLFVSPDQQLLWCVTSSDGVVVLAARDLKPVVHYDKGAAVARQGRFNGGFGALRWTGNDVVFELWNGTDVVERSRLAPTRSPVSAGALASDGSWVAVGTDDGEVEVANEKGLGKRVVHPGHRGSIASLEISPGGAIPTCSGHLAAVPAAP